MVVEARRQGWVCPGQIVFKVLQEQLSNLCKELPVETEQGLKGKMMVACMEHLSLHLCSSIRPVVVSRTEKRQVSKAESFGCRVLCHHSRPVFGVGTVEVYEI